MKCQKCFVHPAVGVEITRKDSHSETRAICWNCVSKNHLDELTKFKLQGKLL